MIIRYVCICVCGIYICVCGKVKWNIVEAKVIEVECGGVVRIVEWFRMMGWGKEEDCDLGVVKIKD